MAAFRVMLFLAMLTLVGCGSQFPGNDLSDHFSATTISAPSASPDPDTALPEYHLSPGDLLDISVFQVPDLTTEVQIDNAGMLSLPLIGQIKAAGMTTPELQAEITKKLKAKYLQSPQVSVFLKNSPRQRVTVSGAVARPGVYQIQGRMTLVQALAFSGGLSPVGDPDAVLVFRKDNGRQMAAKFNVDAIEAGKATDPTLDAGDMVVVDTSGTRSVWQGVKDALPVAGLFAIYTAPLI